MSVLIIYNNVKKLYKIIIVLWLIISFSCDNESVEEVQVVITDPLHGTWNMISLVGGDFIPVNISYNTGDRSWAFDTENGILTTTNNLFPDTVGPLDNGERNYIIEPDSTDKPLLSLADYDSQGILTGTVPIGRIEELTNESLIIKSISVSPPIWTFSKQE